MAYLVFCAWEPVLRRAGANRRILTERMRAVAHAAEQLCNHTRSLREDQPCSAFIDRDQSTPACIDREERTGLKLPSYTKVRSDTWQHASPSQATDGLRVRLRLRMGVAASKIAGSSSMLASGEVGRTHRGQ